MNQFIAANWLDLRRWSLLLVLFLSQASAAQSSESTITKTLEVSGGRIDITLPGETMKSSRQDLIAWIQNAARAVSLYYGHFPVPHLTLIVRAGNGARVHGTTYPKDGGLIRVSVGRETPPEQLKDDWVLPHEMTHLAFPDMPEDQHWIEEGLATYIEPVARAQAGQLSSGEVWRSFITDMPQGEPEAGDQGLDNTHTWGRTYWGGALFALVADVRIRERTHNRKGLQDALRGILGSGGNITKDWSITQAFAAGDRATGTKVLEEMYAQMSNKAVDINLPGLWKKLGLSLNRDDQITINDRAPFAAIRNAITASRAVEKQKTAPSSQ